MPRRDLPRAEEPFISHTAKIEAQQDAARMPETIAIIPSIVNYDIFKKLDNSAIDL